MNIAGTGPIFGSVLGDAVHDYMVGMVSERHEGMSIAPLIARLTPMENDTTLWVIVILLYYVLATMLPIGKLYPVFGTVLILMAVGILGGTIFGGYHVPELTLASLHPQG